MFYFVKNNFFPFSFCNSLRKKINYKNCYSSRFLKIQVDKNQENMRLDRFMQIYLSAGFNTVNKLLRKGQIFSSSSSSEIPLNKIKDPNYRLKENDIIFLKAALKKEKEIDKDEQTENINLIKKNCELVEKMKIYEDKNFIILNKLGYICSQGGTKVDFNICSILNTYFKYLQSKDNFLLKENAQAFLVHRLDRTTTGILTIAKNRQSAQIFSEFHSKKEYFQKYYIGLVKGVPSSLEGKIDCPISYKNNNIGIFQRKKNINDDKFIKECVTLYKTLAIISMDDKFNVDLSKIVTYEEDGKKVYDELNRKENIFSLVKFRILDGRKHQIRVHSSKVLKTPIINDDKYGVKNNSFHKFHKNSSENIYKEKNLSFVINSDGKITLKQHILLDENIEKNLNDFMFLHASQMIFIDFKEREEKFPFKEIRAELPPFFINFLEHCFKERIEILVEKIFSPFII